MATVAGFVTEARATRHDHRERVSVAEPKLELETTEPKLEQEKTGSPTLAGSESGWQANGHDTRGAAAVETISRQALPARSRQA